MFSWLYWGVIFSFLYFFHFFPGEIRECVGVQGRMNISTFLFSNFKSIFGEDLKACTMWEEMVQTRKLHLLKRCRIFAQIFYATFLFLSNANFFLLCLLSRIFNNIENVAIFHMVGYWGSYYTNVLIYKSINWANLRRNVQQICPVFSDIKLADRTRKRWLILLLVQLTLAFGFIIKSHFIVHPKIHFVK